MDSSQTPSNVITHTASCVLSEAGTYIIDITDSVAYYVSVDSTLYTQTTLNEVTSDGNDAGTPAFGSNLAGNTIIQMSSWIEVKTSGYLGTATASEIATLIEDRKQDTVDTSIKFSGLNISQISSTSDRNSFESIIINTIAVNLDIEDKTNIEIVNLTQGSIVCNMRLHTDGTSSADQLNHNLQSYVAGIDTSSSSSSQGSILNPFATIDNFYFSGRSQDVVFTDCPYLTTFTHGESVYTWSTPQALIQSGNTNDNADVTHVFGVQSGDTLTVGYHIARYAAGSDTDSSISPVYCSFIIAVGMCACTCHVLTNLILFCVNFVSFYIVFVFAFGLFLFCCFNCTYFSEESDDPQTGNGLLAFIGANLIWLIAVTVIVIVIINIALICLCRYLRKRKQVKHGEGVVVNVNIKSGEGNSTLLPGNEKQRVSDANGVIHYDELDMWQNASHNNNGGPRSSNVVVQSMYQPNGNQPEGQNYNYGNAQGKHTNDGYAYPALNKNQQQYG